MSQLPDLSESSERRGRLALLLLLAVTFVLKATVLAQLGDHPLLQPSDNLDARSYIDLGHQVADGGPLAVPEPFFVSPLYVYFLAVIFRTGGSLMAAKFAQILLGTAAVWFVYLTARHWFRPRTAEIAAALYAFTGLFTFYETLILQAALDPFLVACALYFVSRTQAADARRGSVLMAGAALGLLALNRPNALAYAAVAGALIAFKAGRHQDPAAHSPWRAALVSGAVFVAGLTLVLAPNALRNYAASGEMVAISSSGGFSFHIGNNPGAEGTNPPVPGTNASIVGQAWDATRLVEAEAGRRLSAGEVSTHFYRRAWEWIAQNPRAAARLFLRKLAITVNRTSVPLNDSFAYYARDESTLLRALVVGPLVLVPLGLAGLFLPSVRNSREGFWVWASFVPIYALSVAAFFVSSRARMPLLVPLGASAGATIVWTLEQVHRRHVTHLLALVAVVGLLGAAASWNLHLDDGRGAEQTRQAVWLVEQGKYDDARQYVDRIARNHAHPGVLRFQYAKALGTAGRFADAIPQYRQALEIDRGQPAIHLELGQALLVSKQADEAVVQLRAAYEAGFRPRVSAPWLRRALAAAGRRDEAAALLAALPLDIVASQTRTAVDLGILALTIDAPAAAERWLRFVVGRDPAHAEAQEKLGVALIMQRRPAEAVVPLEAACRLNPSGATAHLNLAVAYAQTGRTDEARARAERARELDPSEPQAETLLRALERRRGGRSAAR